MKIPSSITNCSIEKEGGVGEGGGGRESENSLFKNWLLRSFFFAFFLSSILYLFLSSDLLCCCHCFNRCLMQDKMDG